MNNYNAALDILGPELSILYNLEPKAIDNAYYFMRFSFYFWSFAEIADIYFLWFIKFFSLDISSQK